MWVWPGAGLCIATVPSLDAVATIPRLWITHVSEVWDERDGEKDWRGEFRRTVHVQHLLSVVIIEA